ncbi:Phytanoyl-CoA dioxygenase [Penicillium verhagenii]|nr:Phytanoyl-CoA dioxygenase [Penicillium verhagenii]
MLVQLLKNLEGTGWSRVMIVPRSGPLRDQAEYEDDIGVALDALETGYEDERRSVDVRLLCGADWQLQRPALAVFGGLLWIFCNHPALYDFIARFSSWNENALSLRRMLLRNNLPGSKPIGVHYDQIFLRHGDPTSITAWVPMGDIKLNGGGLIYLEDVGDMLTWIVGDGIGVDLEQAFFKRAKEAGMSDEEAKNGFNANMMATGLLSEFSAEFAREHGRRRLVSAYEAGDVVLHRSEDIGWCQRACKYQVGESENTIKHNHPVILLLAGAYHPRNPSLSFS